jgi:asparagine synthase (glutamine-hydrolysing)
MSTIAGMYHFNDDPVHLDQVRRLNHASLEREPETLNAWSRQRIGLGYRGFRTNDEPPDERQPLSSADQTCWIVFEGRIDNRDDLTRKFEFGPRSESHSDAKLVLRAYETWGTQCVSHLLGDFTFAIWDEPEQTLCIVRDALGIHPLFYFVDHKRLVFATSITQLLRGAQLSKSIDDEYIANFMVRGDCPTELTPFRTVKRLPAGHSIVVRNNRFSKQKYWDADPSKTIRYQSDQEYEEHFKHAFRKSVAARLRTDGPVAAELSGGLDSSSIVCMVQEIYQAGEVPHRGFLTATITYDEAVQCDERRWSQSVIQKYGLHGEQVRSDEHWPFKDCTENLPEWDEPTPKIVLFDSLHEIGRRLRGNGVGVLLSGIGGDQVFRGSCFPRYLADLLAGFKWRRLLSELAIWQRGLGWPVSKVFLEACVKPLIRPNSLAGASLEPAAEIPEWVSHNFSDRMELADRTWSRGFAPRRYKSPAFQEQYLDIVRSSAILHQGYMLNANVEIRFPFLDRELVEFALSIPVDQMIRPDGQSRSIMRRAMRGILPEVVRKRTDYEATFFDHSLYLGIEKEWIGLSSLLQSSRLAAAGYVDLPELKRELELARVGSSRNMYMLWATLALELWLRSNEFRGPEKEVRNLTKNATSMHSKSWERERIEG